MSRGAYAGLAPRPRPGGNPGPPLLFLNTINRRRRAALSRTGKRRQGQAVASFGEGFFVKVHGRHQFFAQLFFEIFRVCVACLGGKPFVLGGLRLGFSLLLQSGGALGRFQGGVIGGRNAYWNCRWRRSWLFFSLSGGLPEGRQYSGQKQKAWRVTCAR